MISASTALSVLPDGLRKPLLQEYNDITTNFIEHRWSAAELSAGRFCEVVYSVLDGFASGSYAAAASKPKNFVDACRKLENNAAIPRSFRILIPRLLVALYEIRNNRNVGHVGGDVNPDAMDSSAVVSIASWVLAELIRVLHGVSTVEAQQLVDSLAERSLPVIWKSGDVRRVLDPDMTLRTQILLLLHSCNGRGRADEVRQWTEAEDNRYFTRTVRDLHKKRFVEFREKEGEIELLPPGSAYLANVLELRANKK